MRSRQEEDKATAAARGRSAGVQDGYLPLAEQAVEGVGVKQRLVEVASLIVAHLRGRRVANELLRRLSGHSAYTRAFTDAAAAFSNGQTYFSIRTHTAGSPARRRTTPRAGGKGRNSPRFSG
jgi:hypothetical protein